jgi:HEAT repeat protein
MAMLENNLGLLVERRDFEVAADAAESLVEAEKRRDIDETRRKRIRAAIAQLAQPDQMRGISAAMRVHRSGTPEYEACRRLLVMLGENTISSLLEVLAQEQDMTARKALVDMLSAMADRFVHELGERVSDPRWYFVRNVVNILGSTRRPDTLKYLELTLRHPDPRVRRETIRAIGSIRDALAGEMLVSALADEDAGNVQLAARHLGIIKARSAAPALEEVARGEGMGNRDVETRIDAIEALGRIASAESAPVLESLTQRSIRAGRPRELRTAAMSALAAIKLAGGGARG